MQEKDILNKIIENHGDCDWLIYGVVHDDTIDAPCRTCPLSRLEKRADGSYLSCHDSLVKGRPQRSVQDIYLEAASNKLMDILIQEELEKDDER